MSKKHNHDTNNNTLEIECDGCMKTITVPQKLWDDDMGIGLPTCKCGDFYGWMIVGGEAWNDWHLNNIHPLTTFTQDIKEVLDKYFKTN